MERLEAAIKKARGRAPASATGAAPAGLPPLQSKVKEAWDGLTDLSLDPDVLMKNRIMTLNPSPEATAFDVLRTRTLRTMQEQGWKRLAITSPTPGCGKSTIALNMALSMARQPKLRTVTLEMDMRRSSQQRLLGLRDRKQPNTMQSAVARLLSGNAPFEEVARRVGPNLAMVTNEGDLRNASDILLDAELGAILDRIERDYQPDIMLFDMPPVLLTDDTLAFMNYVDAVMLIAASETTTIAEIDRCERELAVHTNVMGVVLNKCRLSSREYGSYGYKYGYSYGY